ncbi:MAG TPA: hypothetical protein VIV61_07710 [Candidatus Ozemobacteraceae bacterium]
MKYLLALDPGSDKCGYAVVRYDRSLVEKGVVYLAELHRTLQRICRAPLPEVIVLGSGTAAAAVSHLIEDLDLGVPVRIGEERNSTREARDRYFRDHPPTGLWRLVPLGLQIPPVPVDDYAALIIAERYIIKNKLGEENAPQRHGDTEVDQG